MEYTEEQLNNFDKTTLVQLFLVQQSQLRDIDQKLQLLLEQVAVLNNTHYGAFTVVRADGSIDEKDLEILMPWSKALPAECYKRRK